MMMYIEMSEQDYRNLQAFLERVTLTGKESLAYVSIMQSLLGARPLDSKDKEDIKEVK